MTVDDVEVLIESIDSENVYVVIKLNATIASRIKLTIVEADGFVFTVPDSNETKINGKQLNYYFKQNNKLLEVIEFSLFNSGLIDSYLLNVTYLALADAILKEFKINDSSESLKTILINAHNDISKHIYNKSPIIENFIFDNKNNNIVFSDTTIEKAQVNAKNCLTFKLNNLSAILCENSMTKAYPSLFTGQELSQYYTKKAIIIFDSMIKNEFDCEILNGGNMQLNDDLFEMYEEVSEKHRMICKLYLVAYYLTRDFNKIQET